MKCYRTFTVCELGPSQETLPFASHGRTLRREENSRL